MTSDKEPTKKKRIISAAGSQVVDLVARAAQGRFISSRFFKRYMVQTVFAVGLALMYISNRYDCITGMETVTELRTRLEVVRTELQTERAAYMTATREKAMMQMVDSLHLNLTIQEQPPFEITYNPTTGDGR